MRIAIMGTGGTGGYFGGLLARAGHDVIFIARGDHLKVLRSEGLTVKSRLVGDFTLAVHATDVTQDIGFVDLILFCVKTYDTRHATKQIELLIGPGTMVLPIQNGIDAVEQLGHVIEADHIISGVAYVTSQVTSPGVIAQTAGLGKIVLGEVSGGQSPRTQLLQRIFQQAHIPTDLPKDIRIALWEKFLFVCSANGVTALTRLSLGRLFAYQETSDLMRGVMQEVVQLAQMHGILLPEDTLERNYTALTQLEPWTMGSMAFDLLSARRLELESLNGSVVRLARQYALATPLNFAIYAALKPYAEGNLS